MPLQSGEASNCGSGISHAVPPITSPASLGRAGGAATGRGHDDIMYPSAIPFIFFHLASFAAIWSGITWQAVALCAALYWLRIFSIGAGYHRYFAHRAYSTSRVFQFILAFLSQSSAQKSILWWAAKHRHHHLHSDTQEDVHSPRRIAHALESAYRGDLEIRYGENEYTVRVHWQR